MVRVCLDTNVWISGFLFSGAPAEIVDLARRQKFQLVLSNFILDELARNLIDKFAVNHRAVRRFVRRVSQIADIYNAGGTIRVISDKHADNLILETAVLGNAKYLVTGDKRHLLPLRVFRNVKILQPAEFLQILKR